MAKKQYEKWLFAALLLFTFTPMVQQGLNLYASKPLDGGISIAANAPFSAAGWWSGEWQEQKSAYFNDNMGFRPELVRMNNELDLILFRKLHAQGVIIGRDGCLYEQGYIDEYTGLEYIEDSIIQNQLVKLKMIQDTLGRLGKTFVFVEAASKAYYYPDKFPDNVRNRIARQMTTSRKHVRLCDSLGIHHIDMNGWFARQRATAGENKLFSFAGTHWSVYGSLLAADSITKYINAARGIELPRLQITRMHYSDTPQQADDDIAKGLNVFSVMNRERLCYPDYEFISADSAQPAKIVFLGDSFLWTMVYNRYMASVSPEWEFWYYFSEVWKADGKWPMDTYDWKGALMSTDCIVAMYGTVNLKTLHHQQSFISQMFAWFYPGKAV